MTLDQLHQVYGQKMIQLEILQNQIMEIKKQIAEEMQKPRMGNAIPLDTPVCDPVK